MKWPFSRVRDAFFRGRICRNIPEIQRRKRASPSFRVRNLKSRARKNAIPYPQPFHTSIKLHPIYSSVLSFHLLFPCSLSSAWVCFFCPRMASGLGPVALDSESLPLFELFVAPFLPEPHQSKKSLSNPKSKTEAMAPTTARVCNSLPANKQIERERETRPCCEKGRMSMSSMAGASVETIPTATFLSSAPHQGPLVLEN